MPSMIGLQVGQCGNQLGLAFWSQLCKEHGIGPDGMLVKEEERGVDNKDVYFYQVGAGGCNLVRFRMVL